MPTVPQVLAWFSAYTSAAGDEPTRIAVSCTACPCAFSCATRSATPRRTSAANAAPSMIFAAIGRILRKRVEVTRAPVVAQHEPASLWHGLPAHAPRTRGFGRYSGQQSKERSDLLHVP